MGEENGDGLALSMSGNVQLAYLFNEVYYPFIIEHVKFNEILCKVHCMREHAAEILATHNTQGGKEAAIKFMGLLQKRPDGNNYQELLQALKDSNYNLVVRAIEKGEIKYQQEEHKMLVSLFPDHLKNQVDAKELAVLLLEKDVISPEQELLIRRKADEDPVAAVFMLIDDIPRKSVQWFRHFWEALYSLDKMELCEKLSPDWFNKKNAGETLDDEDDEPSLSYNWQPVPTYTYRKEVIPDVKDDGSQQAAGCQAGSRCECVAEIKNLQQQIDDLKSIVKADSDKLEEILSLLRKS